MLLLFYSYINASPCPMSMSDLSVLEHVQMHASLLAFAGETALTLAAGSGEQLTVQLLLEQGADISRCRIAGAQAIHTAAASGAVHHACMVLCYAVLCCAVHAQSMALHGIAVLQPSKLFHCMSGHWQGTQKATRSEHIQCHIRHGVHCLLYNDMHMSC